MRKCLRNTPRLLRFTRELAHLCKWFQRVLWPTQWTGKAKFICNNCLFYNILCKWIVQLNIKHKKCVAKCKRVYGMSFTLTVTPSGDSWFMLPPPTLTTPRVYHDILSKSCLMLRSFDSFLFIKGNTLLPIGISLGLRCIRQKSTKGTCISWPPFELMSYVYFFRTLFLSYCTRYEGCPESSRTLPFKRALCIIDLWNFCINKYQLSGTMYIQYDWMFLYIDWFISH